MNKKILLTVLSAVLFTVFAYSSPSSTKPNTNPDVTNSDTIYSTIGIVNKVYKASSVERLFTGDRIPDMFGCNEVEYTCALVEYDSLNEEFLNYVNKLPKEKAYLRQLYPDVVYNESEVYVEFLTYTNTATNEIITHDIRIFYGDFLNPFYDSFYAKCILFDPTLTIDLNWNKNIKTGEYINYFSDDTSNGDSYEIYKSVNDFPAEFSKYGSISKVYAVVDSNNQITKRKMNDRQYYITYYVEYSSFYNVTKQYYDNRKDLYTNFTCSQDFNIDSSKKYIKFLFVYDNDTDKNEWASGCISDPKDFPYLTYGVEIETLYFYDTCPDLYSKMQYLSQSKFKEIDKTKYPEDFSKYGIVNKVYACVFNDGTIADDHCQKQQYYETYYVDYSRFYFVTMDAYEYAKSQQCHYCTKPEKYCVDGKYFMIYTLCHYDQSNYSIECDFYTPEEPWNLYGISDQYSVCEGKYIDFYEYIKSGAYSQ